MYKTEFLELSDIVWATSKQSNLAKTFGPWDPKLTVWLVPWVVNVGRSCCILFLYSSYILPLWCNV